MPAPPRCRWLRFSLRTLLVLVTALGVWLGIAFNRAREQTHIVQTIYETGYVYYDYSRDEDGGYDAYGTSGVPTWLLENMGEDFFHDVGFVDVNEVTDETLKVICKLPEIRLLFLDESTITNQGIESLKRQRNLEVLEIDSPYVDDESLLHLASLPTLQELKLRNSPQITDRGLDHLTALVNLSRLWLDDTGVTNSGAAKLARLLPKCEVVVYRGTDLIFFVAPLRGTTIDASEATR